MNSITLMWCAWAAGVGLALCLTAGIGSASAQPAPHDDTTAAVVEEGHLRWQSQSDKFGDGSSSTKAANAVRDAYVTAHRNAIIDARPYDLPAASRPVAPKVPTVRDPAQLPDWVFPALGTTVAIALLAGAATTLQGRRQRTA
jgi:hypothetical protein